MPLSADELSVKLTNVYVGPRAQTLFADRIVGVPVKFSKNISKFAFLANAFSIFFNIFIESNLFCTFFYRVLWNNTIASLFANCQ